MAVPGIMTKLVISQNLASSYHNISNVSVFFFFPNTPIIEDFSIFWESWYREWWNLTLSTNFIIDQKKPRTAIIYENSCKTVKEYIINVKKYRASIIGTEVTPFS